MIEKSLEIKKIVNKEENLDVQGQGCWDDCKEWKNYTTVPKCEYNNTAYNNPFL